MFTKAEQIRYGKWFLIAFVPVILGVVLMRGDLMTAGQLIGAFLLGAGAMLLGGVAGSMATRMVDREGKSNRQAKRTTRQGKGSNGRRH